MNSSKCPKCGHTINSFNLRNLDLFDSTRRFSLNPSNSPHIQENNVERNDDNIHHEPVNHDPHVVPDRSDIYEFEEDDEDDEEEEEVYDQESFSEFEGNISEKGLEKDIIDNMEIFEIKNVEKLDEEKKNCLIFFENNKDGDKCIALPCMHIFHADCIKTWLNKRGICPICKHEIKYDYFDIENANF